MDAPNQHLDLSALLAKSWPIIASGAGAILSLAFTERLNIRGKALGLAVGLTTAVFAGPPSVSLVNHFWPWLQPAAPAVHFFIGLSAMSAISPILRWVASFASNPILGLISPFAEALLRFKTGK